MSIYTDIKYYITQHRIKKDHMAIVINKVFFFYPLVLICMCLDFFSMFWFGAPLLYSLLALSAVAFSYKMSTLRMMFLFTAVALESFILYGQWGVQLIYLIPFALFARATWEIYTHPLHHAIIVILGCLGAQILIIDTQVGSNIASIFTLMKILINLLLTISISLTYI